MFFILTVAAAESAIGLAILVALFRNLRSIHVDDLGSLKGYAMDLITWSSSRRSRRSWAPSLAGFLGWKLGRTFAHSSAILSVAVSFAASVAALLQVVGGAQFNGELYTWLAGRGHRTCRSASSSTGSR